MTHTVFGGSGLGLFVCRKLAQKMGGQIEVASVYGKGSEFRFFIRTTAGGTPRTPAETTTPMQELDRRLDIPRTPISKQPGIETRVLVVEDNLINRTVLLRQLKHVGIVADCEC